MKHTIVFAGSRAHRPSRGGQFWVFLQYLLGFRQLGYEVKNSGKVILKPLADQPSSSLRKQILMSINSQPFPAFFPDIPYFGHQACVIAECASLHLSVGIRVPHALMLRHDARTAECQTGPIRGYQNQPWRVGFA